MPSPLSAVTLWRASMALHAAGHPRLGKVVKALNFHVNHALLPTQAVVGARVTLEHHGMGIVIHPNTTLGDDVVLWHGVTIAAETQPGSAHRVVVGDGVTIGTGATIVARLDRGLTVGAGARIGAGAVVTSDVEAGLTYVGVPARPVVRNRRERGPQ